MLHIRPITVERFICTCDRCGREMSEDSSDIEYQERLTISFRAGYGSVFGDGNLVEGDFCQQCIQDVLGKYLTITPDHPFRPEKKPESAHWRAFQQYQLHEEIEKERQHLLLAEVFPKQDKPA